MTGENFKSAFLQAVFQEQADRQQEYQRLDQATKARIAEIDTELDRIETELDGIMAAIQARGAA